MIPAGCVEIYIPELSTDLPHGRMGVEVTDELWKLLGICSKRKTLSPIETWGLILLILSSFDTDTVGLLGLQGLLHWDLSDK